MTPEEKAKQLLDKFQEVDECDVHYYDNQSPCIHQAKQCAIICVEQIIQELGSKGVYEYADPMVLVFYQKVLEHIKNS